MDRTILGFFRLPDRRSRRKSGRRLHPSANQELVVVVTLDDDDERPAKSPAISNEADSERTLRSRATRDCSATIVLDDLSVSGGQGTSGISEVIPIEDDSEPTCSSSVCEVITVDSDSETRSSSSNDTQGDISVRHVSQRVFQNRLSNATDANQDVSGVKEPIPLVEIDEDDTGSTLNSSTFNDNPIPQVDNELRSVVFNRRVLGNGIIIHPEDEWLADSDTNSIASEHSECEWPPANDQYVKDRLPEISNVVELSERGTNSTDIPLGDIFNNLHDGNREAETQFSVSPNSPRVDVHSNKAESETEVAISSSAQKESRRRSRRIRKVIPPTVKANPQYITIYEPYNVNSDDYSEWKRVALEASDGSGLPDQAYWIECVADKRMKNGEPHYLIKYMGYSLSAGGQFWWHTAGQIKGSCDKQDSKITHYEDREKIIRKFAQQLKKKEGHNFTWKYPTYERRKMFSEPGKSSRHSRHLDQLLRKESYINYLLDAHGQKPLYFVNWTDSFELADDSQFMKRPDRWTEESRKSLSFEYLLSTVPTKGVLDELAKAQLKSGFDHIFKCACRGKCLSSCPCNKMSKSTIGPKIIRNNLVYNANSEDTISLSCGPRCLCSDECLRKIPLRGRQYPLIIFYDTNKGWGVHAACNIPEGTFLGIYTGILDQVGKTDEAHYQFLHTTNLDKEDGPEGDSDSSECLQYTVDSGVAGNEFSLINHSCKDGNVRAIDMANCNNSAFYEVGFISTKEIKFGEELSYNYLLRDGSDDEAWDNLWARPDDDDTNEKPRVKCYCRVDCKSMI